MSTKSIDTGKFGQVFHARGPWEGSSDMLQSMLASCWQVLLEDGLAWKFLFLLQQEGILWPKVPWSRNHLAGHRIKGRSGKVHCVQQL